MYVFSTHVYRLNYLSQVWALFLVYLLFYLLGNNFFAFALPLLLIN